MWLDLVVVAVLLVFVLAALKTFLPDEAAEDIRDESHRRRRRPTPRRSFSANAGVDAAARSSPRPRRWLMKSVSAS